MQTTTTAPQPEKALDDGMDSLTALHDLTAGTSQEHPPASEQTAQPVDLSAWDSSFDWRMSNGGIKQA